MIDALLSESEPLLIILLKYDNVKETIIIISLFRNFMDITTALAFEYLAYAMGMKRRLLEVAPEWDLSEKSNSIGNFDNNNMVKLSYYDMKQPIMYNEDDSASFHDKKSSFKEKRVKGLKKAGAGSKYSESE